VEANAYRSAPAKKITLQYMIKLKFSPSSPAYSRVLVPGYKARLDARPTDIPTTGIRMQRQLSETASNPCCISRSGICAAPPLLLRTASFIDCLHQLGSKREIAPDLFKSKFSEMLAALDGCERTYTDGPAVASSSP
jgi:hypothetical protein